MPFKSEAQRRLFHVKAAKGEISPEVVKEWEDATPDKKKLPMHLSRHKLAAAPIDEPQLQRLGIKPGETVSFKSDIAHKLLDSRDEAKGALTSSLPIRIGTGSPVSHSGMMLGIDNEGKGPMVAHNWADPGTQVNPLRDHLDTTSVSLSHPKATTPDQRLRAAAQALTNHQRAEQSGTLGYSNKNLRLTGLNQVLRGVMPTRSWKDRLTSFFNSKAEVCPPGQGICSTMIPDAYAGQMGADDAAKLFGVNPRTAGNIGFTPAGIQRGPTIQQAGKYTVPSGPKLKALLKTMSYALPTKKQGEYTPLLLTASAPSF